jgi:hypothetical protein
MTAPPPQEPAPYAAPALAMPDLAIFGRRATRRAVVRGVLRTAVLALVLYVLFGLLGSVVGFTVYKATGRDDAFERVGIVGMSVAHPTLNTGTQSFGTQRFGWWRMTKTDSYVQPDGSLMQTDLRMDVLGRITVKSPLGSKLDQALFEGRARPTQAAAFVRGLPPSAVADAIVDFEAPLDNDALTALTADPRVAKLVLGQTMFYEDPFAGPRRAYRVDGNTTYSDGAAPKRTVAWPTRTTYGYPEFAKWTAALKQSDDANLARLGLPPSATLKRLGKASLVHGVYVEDATPGDLALLLANPRVRSITPVDVRLTIANRDQSR